MSGDGSDDHPTESDEAPDDYPTRRREAPEDYPTRPREAPRAQPAAEPLAEGQDRDSSGLVAAVDEEHSIDDDPTTVMAREQSYPDDPLLTTEETMRMSTDQVNRRALPFKRPGDRRHRAAPSTEPSAPTAQQAAAPSPPPTAVSGPSVWSASQQVRREDLPSALAPISGSAPLTPKPRKSRATGWFVLTSVALLLSVAAVIWLSLN